MIPVPPPHSMPLPVTHFDNVGFWQGVKNHGLVIQKCKGCGAFRHPPRPMCPKCRSLKYEWAPSTGKGKVYSWVTYRQSPHLGFKAPYTVVLVELEEGVRVVSSLTDYPPEKIRIGMPVQVTF